MAALRLIAGRTAAAAIEANGLWPADIRLIPGAAGGPKWLILKALDDFLFGTWLAAVEEPIDLVGASIGSWRFAAAIAGRTDRLASLYVGQRYSARPDVQEISGVAEDMIANLLDGGAADAVASHAHLRLAILAVRSRGPLAVEAPVVQGAGLVTMGLLNLLHPRSLQIGFSRHAIHHAAFDTRILERPGWAISSSVLTGESLPAALLASGSIPLVLKGVALPDAPPGVYRDGGITDYHLPLPYRELDEGIVLYPHFASAFKPGWFDKALPWRHLATEDLDRVLAVAPSDDFIASLPGGKIPDRTDFRTMDNETRTRAWRVALSAGQQLADEFAAWLARGTPIDRLESFDALS